MKCVTIRDLRQRWPETEKTLALEQELLITRDGKPVARLVRILEPAIRPKRWEPKQHLRWLRRTWGNKTFQSVDAALARDRADRWEADQQWSMSISVAW